MVEQKEKQATKPGQEQGPQFGIQRIYVKDLSVEVPNSPAVFLDEWDPKMHMDLRTESADLGKDIREVVLMVTVEVKLKDKTAFLVELKQAGIFSLVDFPEDQVKPLLGAYCPNMLYPYAREVISDAIVRAGFPHLYLAPVNFDALYQQQQQKQAASE